jgi:hypothetical protein
MWFSEHWDGGLKYSGAIAERCAGKMLWDGGPVRPDQSAYWDCDRDAIDNQVTYKA